ncbi:serine/threonine protein kinase [Phormidium tenue FACHB-886]|nr:serine/threonine protein kinase [Phormidium tenue FACHB-886]
MKHFPDFSAHGYASIRELGRNRKGGRITWQARVISAPNELKRRKRSGSTGGQATQTSEHTVVLKQFCFAQVGSDWSAFSAHQQELKVLQNLSHSGIPDYIESFETTDGFCLVQEYVDARSLACDRTFSPEQVQQIASSALDILVYLQSQTPLIIHRDIKPENILVDDQLKAYLIDFGFARIGSGDVSGSSVFKGTPGFIPPEQLWQPTKATDLYGLGATLLCLLTCTPSTEIHKLTDPVDPYLFQFANHLPTLSQDFIYWLHKMVEPRQNNRFYSAQAALTALQSLSGLTRLPKISLKPVHLELQSNRYGEKLTETIAVSNPVPETLLEGKWEVEPHPHDPPHRPDTHSWISIHPAGFSQNDIKCQIQIDTSKLLEGAVYHRRLLLQTNAALKPQSLTLKISTGSLSYVKPLPYLALILLLLISGGVTWAALLRPISWLLAAKIPVITFLVATAVGALAIGIGVATIGFLLYCILGIVIKELSGDANNSFNRLTRYDLFNTCFWLGETLGFVVALLIGMDVYSKHIFSGCSYDLLGLFGDCLLLALVISSLLLVYENLIQRGFKRSLVYALLLLTVGFGSIAGINLAIGYFSFTLFSALLGMGLPLISLSLSPAIRQTRLLAKYRSSKEFLIKP